MKNYISVYDNVLDADFCDQLIAKFEDNPSLHVKRDSEFKSFTEINFGEHLSFAKQQDAILTGIQPYVKRYVDEHGIKFFPHTLGYEQVRMKRYDVSGHDEFREHVDVGDYASARRFLVMFFYLNDVVEGGETAFIGINNDVKIQPKKGRMLMFPPMWTHPHAGLPPISNPKYICGSYLHYT